MRTHAGWIVLLVAMGLGGCGQPEVLDESGSIEEEVSGTYTFHCSAQYDRTEREIVRIRLTSAHARVTAIDPAVSGVAATYEYNATYHPRTAAHQGQSEYVSHDTSGHTMTLIVDPALRTGGHATVGGDHAAYVDFEGPRISRAFLRLYCKR